MADEKFVYGYCLDADGNRECQAFPVIEGPVVDELHIVNFDINGNVASLTRNDGVVLNSTINFPADDLIAGFSINNGVASITTTDGQTFNAPLPADSDVTVSSFTIVGNVITLTLTDGTTLPITLPPDSTGAAETDGIHLDGDVMPIWNINNNTGVGTITYATVNDLTETAGPPLVLPVDLSFLISPAYSAGNNITFTPTANGFEISATDTDTDLSNTFTTQANGDTLVTQVDINGNPTGVTHTIPAGTTGVADTGPQIKQKIIDCLNNPAEAAITEDFICELIKRVTPVATFTSLGNIVLDGANTEVLGGTVPYTRKFTNSRLVIEVKSSVQFRENPASGTVNAVIFLRQNTITGGIYDSASTGAEAHNLNSTDSLSLIAVDDSNDAATDFLVTAAPTNGSTVLASLRLLSTRVIITEYPLCGAVPV